MRLYDPDVPRTRHSRGSLLSAALDRVSSVGRIIDVLDDEIDQIASELADRLCSDSGYQAILKVGGVGPVLAAIFVAEIGDVGRFDTYWLKPHLA